MKNYSLHGEDLMLEPSKVYYIFDALFLDKVKSKYELINSTNMDEIVDELFPYMEVPFTKIYLADALFKIKNVKKINHDQIKYDDQACFSSDTGLILLIEETEIKYLLKQFDYNELISSSTEDINIEYWKRITADHESRIALVLAPGIGSGFEFDGSGLFRVDI